VEQAQDRRVGELRYAVVDGQYLGSWAGGRGEGEPGNNVELRLLVDVLVFAQSATDAQPNAGL
jgi:hypothetical protein